MKRLLAAAALCMMVMPAGTEAAGVADCEIVKKTLNIEVESKNGTCTADFVRKNIQLTHMGKKQSPEAMGVAFHFSFENVDGQTAVMGELALLQDEVNPVIDELRKGKLDISALHNHMLYEEPRIMFLHFQGIGDIAKQAETVKRAIDRTSK